VAAALVTVLYARATAEARKARTESSAAHAEESGQLAKLLEATTAAHQQEAQERERTLASDLVLPRLVQLRAQQTQSVRRVQSAQATHCKIYQLR
jgi:hypothetical protein